MDLTTVDAVKSYLAITGNAVDSRIASLVSRESSLVERYTGRVYPTSTKAGKRVDGTGLETIPAPEYPIVTLTAVSVCNTPVAASDGVSHGYDYAPGDCIILYRRGWFPRGRLNVSLTYVAGYVNTSDFNVPSSTPYDVAPSGPGRAVTDRGVTYGNGVALSAVTSNVAAGQYTFNSSTGTYGFSASDSSRSIIATYGYIPGPVEQAVIEMVGLDLKQRDNLGIQSKTLAGESISYETKGMTPSVVELLAPYKVRYPT